MAFPGAYKQNSLAQHIRIYFRVRVVKMLPPGREIAFPLFLGRVFKFLCLPGKNPSHQDSLTFEINRKFNEIRSRENLSTFPQIKHGSTSSGIDPQVHESLSAPVHKFGNQEWARSSTVSKSAQNVSTVILQIVEDLQRPIKHNIRSS